MHFTQPSATVRENGCRGWLAASTNRLEHWVIWKGDYKLIYARKSKSNQLFNLKEDPYETKNLIKDPACAKIRKELLALREKYDTEREYDPVAIKDLARLG